MVGLLWFVCLFNYADRQAIFSVFPLLKTEMHLSDVQLGYIASSFMWVYAAAAPFAGVVGDRFRRKHVILGGLIFWSLITIATALSTRYWHLVAFRALEGLGEAFYFPASMSLISAWHGKETRSRAMSWHQSAFTREPSRAGRWPDIWRSTTDGDWGSICSARWAWCSGWFWYFC